MSAVDRLVARRVELEGKRDCLRQQIAKAHAEAEIIVARLDEVEDAIEIVETCSGVLVDPVEKAEPVPESGGDRASRRDVRGEVRAYFAEHRRGVTIKELQDALGITPRSVDLALSYLSKKQEIEERNGGWYPWGTVKAPIEPGADVAKNGAGPAEAGGNGHAGPAAPEPVASEDIDRLLDVLAEAPGPGFSMLALEDRGISPAVVKGAIAAGRIGRMDVDGETIYEIAA